MAKPDVEHVVEVEDLGISVRRAQILKGVSLRVRRGEVLALLGHNGSGKTSLLRAFLGMFRVTSGSVRLFGMPVRRRPTRLLQCVGALLDTPSFYENMTVIDHLRLVRKLRDFGEGNRRQALKSSIEEFGLGSFLKKKLRHCSSGMRKRVAIASAAMGMPELILIDDPTAELDAEGIERLKWFVNRVKQEKKSTVVVATHSLSLAKALSDRVLVLEDGKALFAGDWEAFNGAVGDLYEIEVSGGREIAAQGMPESLGIRSLTRTAKSRYLLNIRAENITEFVKHLVQNGLDVSAVVPVPFSSKEYVERLGAMQALKDVRRDGVRVLEGAVGAGRGVEVRQKAIGWGRRMRAAVGWELKDLHRSAALWVVPAVVALLAGLGIAASIPLQKQLFREEVWLGYLVSNVLAGLFVVGSMMLAIFSSVSICRDYSSRRLRFLFVLPVGNADMLLSKALVWDVILAIYILLCACLIGGALCAGVSLAFGYSWMPEEGGISVGLFCAEVGKMLAGVLVGYVALGMMCTALGTILRRVHAVLSVSVLLLVISFVALPGFRISVLPMSDVIVETVENLLMIGAGILPLSAFASAGDVIGSAAVGLGALAVGLVCFSRKVW